MIQRSTHYSPTLRRPPRLSSVYQLLPPSKILHPIAELAAFLAHLSPNPSNIALGPLVAHKCFVIPTTDGLLNASCGRRLFPIEVASAMDAAMGLCAIAIWCRISGGVVCILVLIISNGWVITVARVPASSPLPLTTIQFPVPLVLRAAK